MGITSFSRIAHFRPWLLRRKKKNTSLPQRSNWFHSTNENYSFFPLVCYFNYIDRRASDKKKIVLMPLKIQHWVHWWIPQISVELVLLITVIMGRCVMLPREKMLPQAPRQAHLCRCISILSALSSWNRNPAVSYPGKTAFVGSEGPSDIPEEEKRALPKYVSGSMHSQGIACIQPPIWISCWGLAMGVVHIVF